MKKLILSVSLVCSLFLACSCMVQADTGADDDQIISAEKKAALDKLFVVMNFDQLMEKTMDSAVGQMEKMYPALVEQAVSSLPVSQRDNARRMQLARKDKFVAFIREVMKSTMDSGFLYSEIYSAYGKNFEANEINDITVFYQSPSGQKILAVMPKLMSQMMQDFSVKMTPIIEKAERNFLSDQPQAQNSDKEKNPE